MSNTPVVHNDLAAFRSHPVNLLVDELSRFLGIGRDFIAATQFFSLAAGRMVAPVHLDIVTDQRGVDLAIAERLSTILPGSIASVDTYHQYRHEEHGKFRERAVLHVRSDRPQLFSDILSYRSQNCQAEISSPSVWRISGELGFPHSSPMLRLRSNHRDRQLQNFAPGFTQGVTPVGSRNRLHEILDSICPGVLYDCPFRDKLHVDAAIIEPVLMLVFERMQQLFAHLRRILSEYRDHGEITIHDYEATRVFLVNIPIVAADRTLSAEAVDFARRIQKEVQSDNHQLALPDLSTEGHKWFTRDHAKSWTGQAYNTVKNRLKELEDDGVIISTVQQSHRRQGRQIYFRFIDIRAAPITWTNPFRALPRLGHL